MTSRRLGVVLCLVVLVGPSLIAPQPSASAQTSAGSGGLQIVEHSSTVTASDVLLLTLRLPGVIALDDTLTLTIHEPVSSERDFQATTTGLSLGGVLATPVRSTLRELEPNTFGLIDLALPFAPPGSPVSEEASTPGAIWLAQPGVYPVTIELRTAGQELVGRVITYVIRLPDTTSEQTPRVLPVVLAIELTSDLTPAETRSWLDLLGRMVDLPIILSIDPELVVAVAGAPELVSFAATSEQRILTRRPQFPIDEAALLNAGLAPELDALFTAGDRVLQLTRTPRDATFEIHSSPLDVETANALYRRGVRSVVVGPDSLRRAPSQPPRRPVEMQTEGGVLRALLVDDLVDSRPEDAPATTSQRLAARLATIAFADNDSEVTLLIDSEVDLETTERIFEVLRSLELLEVRDIELVAGMSPDVQADNTPTSVVLDETVHTLDRVDSYLDAQQHLAAYRSMIRDDEADEHARFAAQVTGTLRLGMSPDQRTRTTQEAVAFVRQQLSLVDPPPVTSINLTSRQAEIPLSFQNRSTTTLRVELRLVSDKLRVGDFDDGETTTLVLEPGVTTYDFSVEALTTGSFPVTIELFSPDGSLLVGRTQATIRSTTPSGVGLATTIGAAAFLAGWWLFDMRRRRLR